MPDFRDVAQQLEKDEAGLTRPILQRNGKPYLAADGKTKATLTFIGSESKRYRKSRDELYRKAAESNADEDAAATRIAVAAGACTGWTGWGPDAKVEPPCTPENVAVLLSVEHILLQAEAMIGRRSGTDFFDADSSG